MPRSIPRSKPLPRRPSSAADSWKRSVKVFFRRDHGTAVPVRCFFHPRRFARRADGGSPAEHRRERGDTRSAHARTRRIRPFPRTCPCVREPRCGAAAPSCRKTRARLPDVEPGPSHGAGIRRSTQCVKTLRRANTPQREDAHFSVKIQRTIFSMSASATCGLGGIGTGPHTPTPPFFTFSTSLGTSASVYF